jgi:hypothetical protein
VDADDVEHSKCLGNGNLIGGSMAGLSHGSYEKTCPSPLAANRSWGRFALKGCFVDVWLCVEAAHSNRLLTNLLFTHQKSMTQRVPGLRDNQDQRRRFHVADPDRRLGIRSPDDAHLTERRGSLCRRTFNGDASRV